MNHIQFVAVSQTEADIINRHGIAALGEPHTGWWRGAEKRSFAGLGPNEASFRDGIIRNMLMTCLAIPTGFGYDHEPDIHKVLTVGELAIAASRFRTNTFKCIFTDDEEDIVDGLVDAMSEAVCAAHVHYCTHVLITIN